MLKKRSSALLDNYRPLIFLLFFATSAFNLFAQYDSTKALLDQNGYGFRWKNGKFKNSLGTPTDTIKMAVSDSGSIAYKNQVFYYWDGYKWKTPTGAVTWSLSGNSNYNGIVINPGDSIIFFGDSYTAGSGASTTAQRWTSLLSKYFGAVEDNRGIGGTTLENRYPVDWLGQSPNMLNNRTTIPAKTNVKKILVIAYGLNDLGANAGQYTTTNFKLDYDTILDYAINTKKWPSTNILILPPYYINAAGYASYAVYNGVAAPTRAQHLQWVQAVQDVSQKWSTLYFNLFNDQLRNDTTLMTVDGIHTNDAGHEFIAKDVYNYLSNNLGQWSRDGQYLVPSFSSPTSTSTSSPVGINLGGTFASSAANRDAAKLKLYADGTTNNTAGIGISNLKWENFLFPGGTYDSYVGSTKVHSISATGISGPQTLQTYGPLTAIDEVEFNHNSTAHYGLGVRNTTTSGETFITARSDVGYVSMINYGSLFSGLSQRRSGALVTDTSLTNGFRFATLANAPIKFAANGYNNDIMAITGAGKVGILTNNPDSALHVAGGLLVTGGARFSGLPTGPGTKALRVDAAGNLSLADTTVGGSFLPLSGTTYTNTTGNGLALTSSTITTGNLVSLSNTGTAAASNTKNVLAVASTGTNNSQTVTGQTITVTNTGTSSTNVGLSISASGASNNYGLLVPNGYVGVGISAPDAKLNIIGTNSNVRFCYNGGTEHYIDGNNTSFRSSSAASILIMSHNGSNPFVGVGGAGNSVLSVFGSLSMAYTSSAVDITATVSHHTIVLTASGKTVTLPTAVGITGREYTIKLTAAGTGTVATTSSQTIDGSTTYSLSAQNKYVNLQSDGANWVIIGNN